MTLSLQLSADGNGDGLSPDWEKVKTILQAWSQQYDIALPSQLSSVAPDVAILLETTSPGGDILTIIGSLTEQFYDLEINIELQLL
jgi:hypothetical protein